MNHDTSIWHSEALAFFATCKEQRTLASSYAKAHSADVWLDLFSQQPYVLIRVTSFKVCLQFMFHFEVFSWNMFAQLLFKLSTKRCLTGASSQALRLISRNE